MGNINNLPTREDFLQFNTSEIADLVKKFGDNEHYTKLGDCLVSLAHEGNNTLAEYVVISLSGNRNDFDDAYDSLFQENNPKKYIIFKNMVWPNLQKITNPRPAGEEGAILMIVAADNADGAGNDDDTTTEVDDDDDDDDDGRGFLGRGGSSGGSVGTAGSAASAGSAAASDDVTPTCGTNTKEGAQIAKESQQIQAAGEREKKRKRKREEDHNHPAKMSKGGDNDAPLSPASSSSSSGDTAVDSSLFNGRPPPPLVTPAKPANIGAASLSSSSSSKRGPGRPRKDKAANGGNNNEPAAAAAASSSSSSSSSRGKKIALGGVAYNEVAVEAQKRAQQARIEARTQARNAEELVERLKGGEEIAGTVLEKELFNVKDKKTKKTIAATYTGQGYHPI